MKDFETEFEKRELTSASKELVELRKEREKADYNYIGLLAKNVFEAGYKAGSQKKSEEK